MARSEPHSNLQDPLDPTKANAEWESLRNELVALLDQVEEQIAPPDAAHRDEPPARQAETPPAVARPARKPDDRRDSALRSVRAAVDKLADRGAPEPDTAPADSVTDAINQIRSRQGRQTNAAARSAPRDIPATPAAPNVADPEAPRPAVQAAELAGFADAVSQLGERITRFETQMSSRFDVIDQQGDVAGQIAQLSEVIELLANAVGESGQVKRLESQIAHLTEEVSKSHGEGSDAVAAQIETLAESIDKLSDHQVQSAGREAQANALQAESMRVIEESVRTIYDRIDALETARSSGTADFDTISADLAALASAIENNTDADVLAQKIDALGARIGRLEDAPQGAETDMGAVREAVTEAVNPRLTALEGRIDALGTRLDGQPAPDFSAVEAQLQQISQRVEETGSELKSLARLYEDEEPAGQGVDVDALAQAIAARQLGSGGASAEDSLARADLEALETRLSGLLARDGGTDEDSHLSGVRDGITQVDNRLARLEALLSKPAPSTAPAPAGSEAAPQPRRTVSDTMPKDPTSGAPQRSAPAEMPFAALSQATLEPKNAPEPEMPSDGGSGETADLDLDPDTIERPAKPHSRLAEQAAGTEPFAASGATREPQGDAESGRPEAAAEVDGANVSRAHFIEAARRSARQHASDSAEPESRSLIGRAIARFQRSEADAEANDAPPAPDTSERPSPAAHDEPKAEGFGGLDDDVDPEAKRQGFIARHKRPLLLGTALAAVLLLTAQLVISRSQSSQPAAPAPAQTSQTAPAETPAAPEPAEEATPAAPETPAKPAASNSDDTAMTSNVRMIDQRPSLASGAPDTASMMGDLSIDTTETASIPNAAAGYAAESATGNLDATEATTARLPAITAPEDIEPEALRQAAESGNQKAQFEVGAILTEGRVVEQDLSQAAAWYERSAAQGFAPAQYRLGSLYENGQGVEKDLEMARLWYQRAAEAGNRMSMHNLASLYASGALETQDFQAAAHWFEEAAARGLTDSQFNLGMLYARGLGVDQNFEDSYIWFSLAAGSGDEDAATARDDVARSLDADAVQRLNQSVDSWLPARIDMAANFAPIGTWNDEFDPGAEIGNADVIKRVQELLDKLGYDVGTPDGIVGPLTRDAIASFEQETGMSESGAVNPRLLAVLGSQPV